MLALIDLSNSSIFDGLVQEYEAEFSSITGKKKNEEGNYPVDVDWHFPNVGYYWQEGTTVAGFALVESIEGYFEIVDFYVIPSSRGKTIGKKMAFAVFNQHRGPWRVRQLLGSVVAQQFWRKVIGEYTNGNYTESHIDNPPWGVSICQVFFNP